PQRLSAVAQSAAATPRLGVGERQANPRGPEPVDVPHSDQPPHPGARVGSHHPRHLVVTRLVSTRYPRKTRQGRTQEATLGMLTADSPAPARQASASKTTVDNIVVAATELFGARGLRGTTIAAIAREVGLTDAGVLHHFPTKFAIIEAALERGLQQE